ncbi:hypothetical protein EYR40_002403 [Pleurotus pulmonarius]|nr:hypothetical protein EYR40_002403 [Pleurotus pulmonarius]
MKLSISFVALIATASSVVAHGVITTPSPRVVGSANQAACGTGAYTVLKSDKAGPIENAVAKIDSSFDAQACQLFFCKGYQLEDNIKNTRKYAPGTVVPIHVDLIAHHTGSANVSVVNLATQKTIGQPLFLWPVYANDSLGPSAWPKNETDFEITIPDLGSQCSTVGACAIQWWWYASKPQLGFTQPHKELKMSISFATTILLSSATSSGSMTAISTTSSATPTLPNGAKTRGNTLAAAIAVSALGILVVGICIFALLMVMRRHKKQTDSLPIDLEQTVNAETTISGPLDLQKGGLRTLTLPHRTVSKFGPTFAPPQQASKNVGLRVLALPELAKSRKTSTSNNALRSERTQLPLTAISKPLPSYQVVARPS